MQKLAIALMVGLVLTGCGKNPTGTDGPERVVSAHPYASKAPTTAAPKATTAANAPSAIPAVRALAAGAVEEIRCALGLRRVERDDAAGDHVLDQPDRIVVERTATELEPRDRGDGELLALVEPSSDRADDGRLGVGETDQNVRVEMDHRAERWMRRADLRSAASSLSRRASAFAARQLRAAERESGGLCFRAFSASRGDISPPGPGCSCARATARRSASDLLTRHLRASSSRPRAVASSSANVLRMYMVAIPYSIP